MGNSLSQDSQAILEAATAGDANLLKQHIAEEPRLLESVTLLKRRGVLHLAAKSGHPHIISTVVDPLLEAVRQEYQAHLEAEKRRQSEQQQQQQQGDAQPADPTGQQQPQAAQQHNQLSQQGRQDQQQQQQQQQEPRPESIYMSGQQAELQLSSFKRLRHTVNARDLYRRTPLIVAAKQGHLECAHLLVDAASNLFAVDREGNTSLHYAALHGHAEVLEYLLQRAVDRGLGARFVNKRNLSGFSALHYAVWSCRSGVVVPLLAAGADICAVNDRVFDAWVPVPIGSSPLHLAVMRCSTPIAMLLLQHYALQLANGPRDGGRSPTDPRGLINLYGMNPAQLAAHRGNRQMAQLLMPSVSLSRIVAMPAPAAPRVIGPSSLKSIAAGVVRQLLTASLDKVEQQAAQEPGPSTSSCSTGACGCSSCSSSSSNKGGGAGACSIVCVQACGSDESELLQLSPAGAGLDVVVVQADVSAGTTPSSSRSVTPEADSGRVSASAAATAGAAAAGAAAAAPSRPCSTSAFAAASSVGLERTRVVSFSCPTGGEEAERAVPAAAAGAEGDADEAVCPAGQLRHSLTSASSSGWYDELCCVCWESEVTAVLEPCLHAMCLGCARQLVTSSGAAGATCPLCRAYIAGFARVPCSTAQAGKRKKCLLAGAGI